MYGNLTYFLKLRERPEEDNAVSTASERIFPIWRDRHSIWRIRIQ